MADQRAIHSGVRHEGRTITDPDELESVMTPEMQARLEEAGAISGFKGSKKAADAPKAEAPKGGKK
jgi:hypothetical protein